MVMWAVLSILTLYSALARAGLAGFGGDYGEYLHLLQGSVGGGGLDDIEEGQERQEAVMGGEDEELKGGFLRELNFNKKMKKKDLHLHFDVSVLVVGQNMTKGMKKLTEKLKPTTVELIERTSHGGSEGTPTNTEPFDWKALQV